MEECFCPTSLARDRAQGRGKRWGDRHRFSANDHIGLDIILTPYSFTFPLRRGCLVKAGYHCTFETKRVLRAGHGRSKRQAPQCGERTLSLDRCNYLAQIRTDQDELLAYQISMQRSSNHKELETALHLERKDRAFFTHSLSPQASLLLCHHVHLQRSCASPPSWLLGEVGSALEPGDCGDTCDLCSYHGPVPRPGQSEEI